MSYRSYADLNSLAEFSFIAGSEFNLEFTAYEEDGVTPLDLGGATIIWALCPYGQPSYEILQESGVVTGLSTFTVTIPAEDTQNLSGKFIQQPVITSFSGIQYRPAQGVVTILPRIPIT